MIKYFFFGKFVPFQFYLSKLKFSSKNMLQIFYLFNKQFFNKLHIIETIFNCKKFLILHAKKKHDCPNHIQRA